MSHHRLLTTELCDVAEKLKDHMRRSTDRLLSQPDSDDDDLMMRLTLFARNVLDTHPPNKNGACRRCRRWWRWGRSRSACPLTYLWHDLCGDQTTIYWLATVETGESIPLADVHATLDAAWAKIPSDLDHTPPPWQPSSLRHSRNHTHLCAATA